MSLKIKSVLLLLLLILVPLSSGMVQGFRDTESPDNSNFKMAGVRMNTRKLLMLNVQDYDDAGANTKHDPKKKPGNGKP